jgi:hypothetical protein
MTTEQEELFKNDPFVKMCLDAKVNVSLVGGAVVDILEKRSPKDYDVLYMSNQTALEKLGLKYCYDSRTSTTYKKCDMAVQNLKRSKDEFDFTISQAMLKIGANEKIELVIDNISYENKILIPTGLAWLNRGNAINSLKRIPHWQKKGYRVHEMTYKSLRDFAKVSLFSRVLRFFNSVSES